MKKPTPPTANDVKELRQSSGMGMHSAKKILEEKYQKNRFDRIEILVESKIETLESENRALRELLERAGELIEFTQPDFNESVDWLRDYKALKKDMKND